MNERGQGWAGLDHSSIYWIRDGLFRESPKTIQYLHAGRGVFGNGVLILDLSGWAPFFMMLVA
jgi:hypothetical protein